MNVFVPAIATASTYLHYPWKGHRKMAPLFSPCSFGITKDILYPIPVVNKCSIAIEKHR